MELLIAILCFFGVISPDATSTMSQAEMDYLIQCNQTVIQQGLNDPWVVEAVSTSGYEFDRRED